MRDGPCRAARARSIFEVAVGHHHGTGCRGESLRIGLVSFLDPGIPGMDHAGSVPEFLPYAMSLVDDLPRPLDKLAISPREEFVFPIVHCDTLPSADHSQTTLAETAAPVGTLPRKKGKTGVTAGHCRVARGPVLFQRGRERRVAKNLVFQVNSRRSSSRWRVISIMTTTTTAKKAVSAT